jgi:hypothetical protein
VVVFIVVFPFSINLPVKLTLKFVIGLIRIAPYVLNDLYIPWPTTLNEFGRVSVPSEPMLGTSKYNCPPESIVIVAVPIGLELTSVWSGVHPKKAPLSIINCPEKAGLYVLVLYVAWFSEVISIVPDPVIAPVESSPSITPWAL